ncbi:PREDICTED: olfactory receptor 2T3-like [Chinchilla lanigera]|uniref:olfactory receptor 2T3-like n=1 Tax=Chinchilla lanigera TaxID=34839 RepID=UPI000695BEF6|nr:PREDICTED: olfactory receptor 2T3-like [Chinchilla lanigera]
MYSGSLTPRNQTSSTDFILMGLPVDTKHAALLYTVIFIVFLLALAGNALLIFLIHSDPRLCTPMYFLLSQLSLMDLMHISATGPKMLLGQVTGDHTISPSGCGIQMFFCLTLAGAEFLLLGAMVYDIYAAICRPLHYPLLMNSRVCQLLACGSWFVGIFDGLLITPVAMSFPSCKARNIPSFFCETPALLKLSCSDISLYSLLMYLCCVLMIPVPVLVILGSYTFILCLTHRMNSAKGRRKAFSTCSSHVIMVVLFYGAAFYAYILPSAYHTAQQDIMASALYTIITPVLNPFTYSIQNKDIARALRSMVRSRSVPPVPRQQPQKGGLGEDAARSTAAQELRRSRGPRGGQRPAPARKVNCLCTKPSVFASITVTPSLRQVPCGSGPSLEHCLAGDGARGVGGVSGGTAESAPESGLSLVSKDALFLSPGMGVCIFSLSALNARHALRERGNRYSQRTLA